MGSVYVVYVISPDIRFLKIQYISQNILQFLQHSMLYT